MLLKKPLTPRPPLSTKSAMSRRSPPREGHDTSARWAQSRAQELMQYRATWRPMLIPHTHLNWRRDGYVGTHERQDDASWAAGGGREREEDGAHRCEDL